MVPDILSAILQSAIKPKRFALPEYRTAPNATSTDPLADMFAPKQSGTTPAPATQTPVQDPEMPEPRNVAFRTPDLIGLLGAILSGSQGGDFVRGYMGAKQQHADQLTQVDQVKYAKAVADNERERQYQRSVMLRGQDWAREDAEKRDTRAFTASENEKNRGLKGALQDDKQREQRVRDANKALRDPKTTAAVRMEAIGVLQDAGQAFTPEQIQAFATSTYYEDNVAAKTAGTQANTAFTQGPKTDKTNAETQFIKGPKTAQANAQTALTKEKTKDLQTFRPYKVQEYVNEGNLDKARAEYQRAASDHRRMVTRMYPKESAARVHKLMAQADKAANDVSEIDGFVRDKTADRMTTTHIRKLDVSIGKLDAEAKYYRNIIQTAPAKIADPATPEAVRLSLQEALSQAENAIVFTEAQMDNAVRLRADAESAKPNAPSISKRASVPGTPRFRGRTNGGKVMPVNPLSGPIGIERTR